MKVLLIDNYDSFTYNLYQDIGEILSKSVFHCELNSFSIQVKRNDQLSLQDIEAMGVDRIIISPGPGSPDDEAYFGICTQVIKEIGKHTPILGVCLGMQGIVHAFGGQIVRAQLPMHGKVSAINHLGEGLFRQVPDALEVMRYHSLVADPATFPEELLVTASIGHLSIQDYAQLSVIRAGGDFEIMGVKHRNYPIQGIQFHPESFATEGGKEILRNFLLQPTT